jgi:hypothetical protein
MRLLLFVHVAHPLAILSCPVNFGDFQIPSKSVWLGIRLHRVWRCTCNFQLLNALKNAPRDRAFHIPRIVGAVGEKDERDI